MRGRTTGSETGPPEALSERSLPHAAGWLETGLKAYPPRAAALAATNGVENLFAIVVEGA